MSMLLFCTINQQTLHSMQKMDPINEIFGRIEKLTRSDETFEFMPTLLQKNNSSKDHDRHEIFFLLKTFVENIFKEIDELAQNLRNDNTLLISVKNQKLLRNSFQLIVSLGISQCLLPGLGISLSKRSSFALLLQQLNLSDVQKYKLLVDCTEFFSRSYSIPVLKNIIVSFHLSDYLAALIQLCFAPLKKPGVYPGFTMTQEMYDEFNLDRQKYTKIYECLVNNCFQPILMKELLVLQNVNDCTPPLFVQRVVSRELSRRLTVPGGLLSLIRCFIDNYSIDTGVEWKKIDMICKLIVQKHGKLSETEYLENICNQLKQILILNNNNYLTTAVACLVNLFEKFPNSSVVKTLTADVFDSFNYINLKSESSLPGTIIFTTQEIEHKIQIFYSCFSCKNQEIIFKLLTPSLPLLFWLGTKCTIADVKKKLTAILVKSLEHVNKEEIPALIKTFLFGKNELCCCITIEEYQAGLTIKSVNIGDSSYPIDDALFYFINIFQESSDSNFIQLVLETALQTLVDLNLRQKNSDEILLAMNDEPVLLDNVDKQYVNILHLLSVICESTKVTESLRKSPEVVIIFVEYFLKNNKPNSECEAIALILLNTILPNVPNSNVIFRLRALIPTLQKISNDEMNSNSILSKEAISIILGEKYQKKNSAYEKAVSDVFDTLLPTRAHGIIELTKLIETRDNETISKRHFVFCLLQDQLKDSDSYVYLAAINGIASLAMHCTEDVLAVLCREFLNVSIQSVDVETKQIENSIHELRMKIGDVIVKVTKRLGDLCIVHKTLLLNTMLSACRDTDPLIRASALSNLAEIVQVLHYRTGSIIYEVLMCVANIIETDKAVECRRAAVMIISSLLKGLGKETLIQLQENLLPIYKTLNKLYKDEREDNIVRLHAQIALEELNDIVRQFLVPELNMHIPFTLLNDSKEIIYK